MGKSMHSKKKIMVYVCGRFSSEYLNKPDV